jgi:ABC-type antimicrobial peptide transport system permease subunit
VKTAIAAMDKRIVVSGERTIEEQIDRQIRAERLLATFGTLFGSAGLVLAAIGLYGLMTYTTSVRKREFGIMMALGARSYSLMIMVLGQSLRLIGIGVAIGMTLTFCLVGYLRSLLSGVDPMDPKTLAGSTVIIIAVAGVAACFPAWHVTRVNPVESLRPQ